LSIRHFAARMGFGLRTRLVFTGAVAAFVRLPPRSRAMAQDLLAA
jgi:hypothetical protein